MPPQTASSAAPEQPNVSGDLERRLSDDGPRTLGSLIDLFGLKSFALVFVLLLGIPALPLPTGGATHVFEIIAVLVALELIVGRKEIWLPRHQHSPLATSVGKQVDDGDAVLRLETFRHERAVTRLRAALHAEERRGPVRRQLGDERREIRPIEDVVQVALAERRCELDPRPLADADAVVLAVLQLP